MQVTETVSSRRYILGLGAGAPVVLSEMCLFLLLQVKLSLA